MIKETIPALKLTERFDVSKRYGERNLLHADPVTDWTTILCEIDEQKWSRASG